MNEKTTGKSTYPKDSAEKTRIQQNPALQTWREGYMRR